MKKIVICKFKSIIRIEIIMIAFLLFLISTPQALAGLIGHKYAWQYTSYSNGSSYYGWLGVDGYISPPNPSIYRTGDFSLVYVDSLTPQEHWIQAGYGKGNLGGYNTSGNVYIYSEVQDKYGYHGFFIRTDLGDQSTGIARAFYTFYDHYDAARGTYVYNTAINNLSGIINFADFTQLSSRSDASGEVYLSAEETAPNITEMGRSWFGSSNASYALHLKSGSGAWQLWDTSLSAQTTSRGDLRPTYFHSIANWWYRFVVYGPNN